MHLHARTLLAFGFLLVSRSALLAQDRGEQARAIAEIKKATGFVVVDEERPGKPVVRVGLNGSPSPAVKWAHLIKTFPQLEEFSAC